MKSRALLMLALVAFLGAINAEELPIASAAGTHVDIEKVVATGEVAPVAGITSAGQPDVAALRVFADSGYAVVIDMRGPDEDRGLDDEQASVEALGMDYVAFPINSPDDINFEMAGKLEHILQRSDGPVLLHCGSGNRVGAVLALRHSLQGAGKEESIEHGRDAGLTRLEGVVRDRLSEQ